MTNDAGAARAAGSTHALAERGPSADAGRDAILILVDTQVDFVMRHGLLHVPFAETIIPLGIGVLANLDRRRFAAVLFTHDTHDAAAYAGSPENVGRPDLGIPGFRLHCERGTVGWENVFHPGLVPSGIPVHRLDKAVFDAWEDPHAEVLTLRDDDANPAEAVTVERETFFAGLAADGIRTAVVMGVASDYCVRDMVAGLLKRSFRVEVIGEATAGIQRGMAQVVADEFAGRVTLVGADVPSTPPAPEAAND